MATSRRARITPTPPPEVAPGTAFMCRLEAWFAGRGWQAFDFQRRVWTAMAAGHSGLLHANTGAGKTYSVWMGALGRAARLDPDAVAAEGRSTPPLQVLWITPMRALAADTVRALALTLTDLAPRWTLGQRTGDTTSSERARQDRRMPTALVTTPESLSLLLSRESARHDLAAVHTVIVDEWHELMGNKRGVQVQLALARLKRWHPQLVVWGLSATLGNLDEAMAVLLGRAADGSPVPGEQVTGRIDKTLVIDTLLPDQPGRFSWGGHLGAQMLEPVVAEIERSGTTLVFTNTRSQAEIWYQMVLGARPDWAGVVALHHGSLDKSVRDWVEGGLKQGLLKAVVATSSLDLGVDFLPVERVLQIGSAKGVARLLQRAGRSGHAPGRPSRITLVPTNTLELVEAAAARRAALAGRIERRATPEQPLDVLVQHLVTIALGGGYRTDDLYDEIRMAHAYRDLSRDAFDWVHRFVERGGDSLGAYPEYHRVQAMPPTDGDARPVYRVPDRGIAQRHRLAIGTIVSDSSMLVKWLSSGGMGGTIGTIEESFIARLRPGDCFVFAGRVLEYVRTQDMAAFVRKAARNKGAVPSWQGGKMPLSSELADAVQEQLARAAAGDFSEPEMAAAQPMLDTQQLLSALPLPGRLLAERLTSREGHHLYLYPFAGRHVHIGLGGLLAWRLARDRPNTFSIAVNDYGFELMSAEPVDVSTLLDGRAFDPEHLLRDVLASLNSGELAQRRFREIARVAGLVFSGYPGAPKSTRQIQASSSLFYEVFRKHDSANRLLSQAEHEVLDQELELERLRAVLQRLSAQPLEWVDLETPSPFCLPLMVERLREKLSTEKLADRLARIVADAQKVLDGQDARPSRPRRRAGAPSQGSQSSKVAPTAGG
jgi:ATP-dependent helicase Lhr and Lhr-like helicase